MANDEHPTIEAASAVDDLLSAAESFSRAGDYGAACVRARAAVAEAAREQTDRREDLQARAELALARHERALAQWQAATADRHERLPQP